MVGVSFPAGKAGVCSSAAAGSIGPVSPPNRDHSVSSTEEPKRRVEGTGAGLRALLGSKSAKMLAPSRRTVRLSAADDEWCTRGDRERGRSLSVAIYTLIRYALTRLGFTTSVSAEFPLLFAFYEE